MRARSWASLLVAILVAVAAPHSVQASCLPTTPAMQFERASLVFAGLPLSVEPISLGDPRHVAYAPNLATFRVTTVWKGTVGDTVQLLTEWNGYRHRDLCIFYVRDPDPALVRHLAGSFERVPFVLYPCSGGGLAKYALWDRYWLPDPISYRSGPRARKLGITDLLNALSSSDRVVRFRAGEALGSFDARAEVLPALRRMVIGHQRGDPFSAAQAIGHMRAAGRPAEPELAWAMLHSTGAVRAAALRALQVVAEPDSFPRYFRLALSDTSNLLLQEACDMAAEGWRGEEREAVGRRMVDLIHHRLASRVQLAFSSPSLFTRTGPTSMDTAPEIGT